MEGINHRYDLRIEFIHHQILGFKYIAFIYVYGGSPVDSIYKMKQYRLHNTDHISCVL